MDAKHLYYRLDLELKSPLSLGSGESENSESDVAKDSCGKPFIPGTSLAGVMGSIYEKLPRDGKGEIEKLAVKGDRIYREHIFGRIAAMDDGADRNITSLITVYDAVFDRNCRAKKGPEKSGDDEHDSATNVTPTESEPSMAVRDGVALNAFKVAKDGAKFDYEIVETGSVFRALIEVDRGGYKKLTDELGRSPIGTSGDAVEHELENIFKALDEGRLKLGHKTTRGFGEVAVSCKKIAFSKSNFGDWLEFDQFKESNWRNGSDFRPETIDLTSRAFQSRRELEDDYYLTIEVPLKQKGGLSIRQYSTEVAGENGSPDYVQLTLKDGHPVIPGTTWAGAFRHRVETFLRKGAKTDPTLPAKLDEWFGKVGIRSKGRKIKSVVEFSESIIDDINVQEALETNQAATQWKTITRNAIDRFTGGTVSGALYTEKTYFDGSTTLVIHLRNDNELLKSLIFACIRDLDAGYLAIGGLTAVGRGLFKVVDDTGNATIRIDGKSHELNGLLEGEQDG
jgi:CRISPR/Cas system CSM-associated protein Csm3 (group 7 of RAMP superfamily)